MQIQNLVMWVFGQGLSNFVMYLIKLAQCCALVTLVLTVFVVVLLQSTEMAFLNLAVGH